MQYKEQTVKSHLSRTRAQNLLLLFSELFYLASEYGAVHDPVYSASAAAAQHKHNSRSTSTSSSQRLSHAIRNVNNNSKASAADVIVRSLSKNLAAATAWQHRQPLPPQQDCYRHHRGIAPHRHTERVRGDHRYVVTGMSSDQLQAYGQQQDMGVLPNPARAQHQQQQQAPPEPITIRNPASAPLRKLSVDLIKTYKHINEVSSQYLKD